MSEPECFDSCELLLVEDNPNDIELALYAFKRNNFTNRVHVARDGAEALAFFFGSETAQPCATLPKLVLLDMKLPKVDGLEVLRQLKTDARTRQIPIVMLTASREEQDVIESYKLGVNSYIVKPVDFEQFTETVRQLGFYWLLINELPPAAG